MKTALMLQRTGSIPRTAEALDYGRGSVYMQIIKLEAELGFSLFDLPGKGNIGRRRRRAKVTDRGLYFLLRAKEAVQLLDEGLQDAH